MLAPMQIKAAQPVKIMLGFTPDFSEEAAAKPNNATAIIRKAIFFILLP